MEVPETPEEQTTLEIGKHYRGTFWINEYGTIQVKPEQKGTNPQGLKKLTEGDDWVIYTSKNLVRIVVSLPRVETTEIRRAFANIATRIMACIVQYDLKRVITPKKLK